MDNELLDALLKWAQVHGIFMLPEVDGNPRDTVAKMARLIREDRQHYNPNQIALEVEG